MQNGDHQLLLQVYPSIDEESLKNLKAIFSTRKCQDFFENLHQTFNLNEELELSISNFRLKKQVFFNLKECTFSIKLDDGTNIPFYAGFTLDTYIDTVNRNNRINNSDKIFFIKKILEKMNSEYGKKIHGHISDLSFFVDSKKNVTLFSKDENERSQIFRQNNSANSTELEKDLNAIGIIIDEIIKVKTPGNDPNYINSVKNSGDFFESYKQFNRILNRFPYKNSQHAFTNYKEILDEIENVRLNSRSLDTKTSFFELLLANLGGINDIGPLFRDFFTKFRELTKEKDDYFLLFNLILHIFLPTENFTNKKIEYLEIFNILINQNVFEFEWVNDYLPDEKQYENLLEELVGSKFITENEKIKYRNVKEIIRSELLGKSQDYSKFLLKVYNNYFPAKIDQNDSNYIFDYFGILNFLVHRNVLFYLINPSLSKKDIESIKEIPNEGQINNFLKKSLEKNRYNSMSEFTSNQSVFNDFDFKSFTNKLVFDSKLNSFFIEQTYHTDNDPEICERIQKQNKIFKNVNSKYVIPVQFGSPSEQMKSRIPLFPNSLFQTIKRNTQNRIITDCDKITWGIQIATAFKDLMNEFNNQNMMQDDDFKKFNKSISDQSFFIDHNKNIYLGTMFYPLESEELLTKANRPIFFRIDNDNNSFLYTYGVLLFEILTEIEPQNLFPNSEAGKKKDILSKGYASFDSFQNVKETNLSSDLRQIIDKCVDFNKTDKFKDFDQILEELKRTYLYTKNKYAVEKRLNNAERIDINHGTSFRSIYASAVNQMSNIITNAFEIISDNFLSNLKTLIDEKILEKFCFPYKYVEYLKFLAGQFAYNDYIDELINETNDTINDILCGLVDDFFGKKTIVLKKSEAFKLTNGIKNFSFFNNITKSVVDGEISGQGKFIREKQICSCKKIPLISLSYYLANKKDVRLDWAYQIIYSILKNGFIPSTDPLSYELKLSDFALYYNNKTSNFDVDFHPFDLKKLEFHSSKKVFNIYSLGHLLKNIVDVNIQHSDDDDGLENCYLNSFREFILICDDQKKSQIDENFEDYVQNYNFSFLFILFKLFLNYLRRVTQDEKYNSITDEKNYFDENYKFVYTSIKNVLQNLYKDIKKLKIPENDDGYYFLYEDDNWQTDLNILEIVFPNQRNIDEIFEKNSNDLQKTIESILIENPDIDEKRDMNFKGNKLLLLKAIFSEESETFLSNSLKEKNNNLYKTMRFIFSNKKAVMENICQNYNENIEIAIIKNVFPQLKQSSNTNLDKRVYFENDISLIKKLLSGQTSSENIDSIIKDVYMINKKSITKSISFLMNLNNPKIRLNSEFVNYSLPLMIKHRIKSPAIERALTIDGELDQRSLAFLIRRFINMRIDVFNYEFSIKIQNNKNTSTNKLTLNMIENIMKKLNIKYVNSNGIIKVEFKLPQ